VTKSPLPPKRGFHSKRLFLRWCLYRCLKYFAGHSVSLLSCRLLLHRFCLIVQDGLQSDMTPLDSAFVRNPSDETAVPHPDAKQLAESSQATSSSSSHALVPPLDLDKDIAKSPNSHFQLSAALQASGINTVRPIQVNSCCFQSLL